MSIKNKDRFPDAKWLTPNNYKKIGTNGTRPLLLVGRTQENEPLVTTPTTDKPENEDLGVATLDDLYKFNAMSIRITDPQYR